MKNLGVAFAGGHGAREKDDFYPTPPEATEALLTLNLWGGSRKVWEPACGDGAISRVLARAGNDVVSTDLIDRGFGTGGVDFLKATSLLAPIVITNPPFKLAEQFIRHALDLGAETVAMLLKMTFWNAAKRIPLFEEHPPAIIAPLTWRLDFTGGGAPTMDCGWAVWVAGYAPCTTHFRLLPKPAQPSMAEMLA